MGSLPTEVTRHLSPMDGKSFVTAAAHETWVHDLKIVSTRSSRGETTYQFHHQRRVAKVPKEHVPQVKFLFDMEPFSVLVQAESKHWYDFCTSLLAILGGSFVTMRLMAHASVAAASMFHKQASSGGLNIGQYE